MKLAYFKMPRGNFGDDLNLWLWDDVLPGWRDWAPATTLLGIGTILKDGFVPKGPKLVLGSGTGYGRAPDVRGPDWDIRAVRGPLTCERLGLPRDRALSDPAILLPDLARLGMIARTGETLFVPHYSSDSLLNWHAVCSRAGMTYQTPVADPVDVVRRIAGADRVIAESMHAAIVADAFGVPWRGVRIGAGFNLFKWQDWWSSLDDRPLPAPHPFFRSLRAAQGLVRPLLGALVGRPRSGGTAAGTASDHPVSRPMPWLGPLALADLRRAAAGPFVTSTAYQRAACRARWQGCLAAVRHDYAAHPA